MKYTIAFALLAASLLHAETPATNLAISPVPRVEPGNQARHARFNEISKAGTVQLVFLGDSITQGWEGAGRATWEKYWAPLNATNFGIGGDRTEHILWRLDHGNFDGLKPKAIVLLVGTNNSGHIGRAQKELDGAIYHCTAEETAQGVKAILDKLKTKLPETKVLLLAIFPRGADANDSFRKQNDATNAIIKNYADDKSVFFMDIADKLMQPDGTLSKDIMPDLLHLSPEGYDIWAEAIHGKVVELLK